MAHTYIIFIEWGVAPGRRRRKGGGAPKAGTGFFGGPLLGDPLGDPLWVTPSFGVTPFGDPPLRDPFG